MKILVADDDLISRRMIQRMLEASGHEVLTAENGREALNAMLWANSPRLAVLDWSLPGLDGVTVCQEIKSLKDDISRFIILLTSKQSSSDLRQGLENGVDDYLEKPCKSTDLMTRVLLGRRILQLEDKLTEAREDVQFAGSHDSLTLLWNRATILALLKSELYRAARTKRPVSIMLCDIDHFHQVNENFSTAGGDAVLREVANRLTNAVRPYDAVGRSGGEEFLMILSECDSSGIRVRAERIRESISDQPFLINRAKASITISIGVLTVDNWKNFPTLEMVLSSASTALAQAKSAGRNCVAHSHAQVPA